MLQKILPGILICLIVAGIVLCGSPVSAQDAEPPVKDSGPSDLAFMITDRTLTELQKQEFPEELLAQLEPLKDTLFSTEGLFVNALEEAIGQEALEQHRAILLELAYVYDHAGQESPFDPKIKTDQGDSEVPTVIVGDECPPPLGQYDIGQFQVIGVVLGEPGDRAKVKAPDGEAYTITLDDCLGRYSGKVMAISENCVTIRETKRYKKGDEVSEKEEDTDLCLKSDDK